MVDDSAVAVLGLGGGFTLPGSSRRAAKVKAAGEFRTKGSKITKIMTKAGHYPGRGPLQEADALEAFTRYGMNLPEGVYHDVLIEC